MMHKAIKKLFFKPTYCAYCCKKIKILIKKSVKCEGNIYLNDKKVN